MPLRRWLIGVLSTDAFEYVIMGAIVLSSIALALGNPRLPVDSPLARRMDTIDVVCVAVFGLEAVLKIAAFGFATHEGAYLSSGWDRLDFIIAVAGVLNQALKSYSHGGAGTALRAVRTLRALRPLRFVSRFPGMKVVVDALIKTVPGIGNVLLVTLLIYIMFGILGVDLFMNKTKFCQDQNGNRIDPGHYGYPSITRDWCNDNGGSHVVLCPLEANGEPRLYRGMMSASFSSWTCNALGYPQSRTNDDAALVETWGQQFECKPDPETTGLHQPVLSLCPPSALTHLWYDPFLPSQASASYSFDNVGVVMLLLFEMASQESWTDVQYATMQAVGVDQQPLPDHNPYNMFFCLIYMVVGSFFLIQLFVTVTIDKFNEMKDQNEGRSLLMTPEQEDWLRLTRAMLASRPKLPLVEPKHRARKALYRMLQHPRFDTFILVMIVANTVVMLMQGPNNTADFEFGLITANASFSLFFLVEAVLKVTAFGTRRVRPPRRRPLRMHRGSGSCSA